MGPGIRRDDVQMNVRALKRDSLKLLSRFSSLLEHDRFGKPVSTFADHALA
jgi:hypothetical protein